MFKQTTTTLRHLIAVGILALITLSSSLFSETDPYEPWVVYYANELNSEAFLDYPLVILDSQAHPPLATMGLEHRILLGYLSLGEAEHHRLHFQEVEHLLLEENPNWPGSFFLDIRDPLWGRLVVEELIPAMLIQGFDGIFIDTLDNPIYLEQRDPEKYAGMEQAATHLIHAIRMHYPDMLIMVNRGYALLPDIASDIDMVLGESVFADYDFTNDTYNLVETSTYQRQVEILQGLQKNFPHLEICSLDYWDPTDTEGIARIYSEQRNNGFRPYVATVKLNEIVPEPR